MASTTIGPAGTRLVVLLLAAISSAQMAFGQATPPQPAAGWLRVHSDNGEFSIEVPVDYAYFADDPGFSVSLGGTDIPLRKMRNLNAMKDGTFVSFEAYEAGQTALDRIYESDKSHSSVQKVDKVKQAGVEIRQIDYKSASAAWTRKLFRSKSHIYILTAGSREPSSGTAAHFFGSLMFEPGTNSQGGAGTAFSSLKVSAPVIEALDKNGQAAAPQMQQKLDPNRPMPVILSKPQASFVEPARSNGVQGAIRLKVSLTKDGSIPKIVVVEGLPDGLLRQAIFAALRIKFLPKLDNGQLANSTVTIEYTFRIS